MTGGIHIGVQRRSVALVGFALLCAAALLAPATASADSAASSVVITAEVPPVFSLTVLTDGVVSFGQKTAGAVYASPQEPLLRVRSRVPWDFTDSSDSLIALGSVVVPREQVVRHAVEPGFDTGITPGVYEITCTYTLDLTSSAARTLRPGVPVSTRFSYTAVQQP